MPWISNIGPNRDVNVCISLGNMQSKYEVKVKPCYVEKRQDFYKDIEKDLETKFQTCIY